MRALNLFGTSGYALLATSFASASFVSGIGLPVLSPLLPAFQGTGAFVYEVLRPASLLMVSLAWLMMAKSAFGGRPLFIATSVDGMIAFGLTAAITVLVGGDLGGAVGLPRLSYFYLEVLGLTVPDFVFFLLSVVALFWASKATGVRYAKYAALGLAASLLLSTAELLVVGPRLISSDVLASAFYAASAYGLPVLSSLLAAFGFLRFDQSSVE